MHNTRSSTRLAFGLAFIALGAARVGIAQDEGVKQVQQLIKKADSTVQSIADAKAQVQKTMEAYNAVVAPDVTDRRDAYKKLQKEMATSDKKRAEVSKKADEMNVEADKLFKGWEASTGSLQNPDLKQRSEGRLKTAKDRYGEIRKMGQEASGAYAPFIKALQEQVTYLGHDLNPSAVASLKSETDKLNAQAKDLYAAIDRTTAAANDNISALKSQ